MDLRVMILFLLAFLMSVISGGAQTESDSLPVNIIYYPEGSSPHDGARWITIDSFWVPEYVPYKHREPYAEWNGDSWEEIQRKLCELFNWTGFKGLEKGSFWKESINWLTYKTSCYQDSIRVEYGMWAMDYPQVDTFFLSKEQPFDFMNYNEYMNHIGDTVVYHHRIPSCEDFNDWIVHKTLHEVEPIQLNCGE